MCSDAGAAPWEGPARRRVAGCRRCDGQGDNKDIDDDNDGIRDGEDYAPLKDAKLVLTLKSIMVKDPPDTDAEAQVFFRVYTDNTQLLRLPHAEGEYWTVELGELLSLGITRTIDIPDDHAEYQINIRAYDLDPFSEDQLDLDARDTSRGISFVITTATGAISGDDTDGVADGTGNDFGPADDDDAVLEYSIRAT